MGTFRKGWPRGVCFATLKFRNIPETKIVTKNCANPVNILIRHKKPFNGDRHAYIFALSLLQDA